MKPRRPVSVHSQGRNPDGFLGFVPLDRRSLEQGGGDSVTVEVSAAAKGERLLPEPVGAIREEFRVDSGTARAYRLRKGDYV